MNIGVAALDSPLVQQTKTEIRTLAAEIGELAHSQIEPEDFYHGFLPRLCVAMGGTAAAVWKVESQEVSQLEAGHLLPPELLSGRNPSEAHARILRCVIAEGQAILVPPNTVTVDADRPTNPLEDALVIVPVRVRDDIDFILEVAQRPAGGPAAQRGYLRFVAQMADLLADYLRRLQLRRLAEREDQLSLTEDWLLTITQAGDDAARCRLACDAIAELLDAEQALWIENSKRPKLKAIRGMTRVDPRSEYVGATRDFLQQKTAEEFVWYHATDRRGGGQAVGSENESKSLPSSQLKSPPDSLLSVSVDRLCELTGCRRLLVLTPPKSAYCILLAYHANCVSLEQSTTEWQDRTQRLAAAISGLVATSPSGSRLARLPFWNGPQSVSDARPKAIQVGLTRMALVALFSVIALFPVPQQISATGILQPVAKNPYYAPADAIVSEVFVESGQEVSAEQPLVQLTSQTLRDQIDRLEGEIRSAKARLDHLNHLLNRGNDLSARESDRLEGELQQLRIDRASNQRQLQILKEQESDLLVVAQQTGIVSSWDLRNRLLNRPVTGGELLVTTYRPEGNWQLELSIPDHRTGMVAEAMEKPAAALADAGKHGPSQAAGPRSSGHTGARVRFSLSSHPDELHEGVLTQLSSHAIRSGSSGDERTIVLAQARLSADELPLKKDGAVARATIDCGRVPAVWLVFRDAVWAISSRLKMIW